MSAPTTMHPNDIFHVIIDVLSIIARMSPEDLARLNSGRPPWQWYDLDESANDDPKTDEGGWRAVAAEAERFALMVLDNGLSENVLGEAANREAMRKARHG